MVPEFWPASDYWQTPERLTKLSVSTGQMSRAWASHLQDTRETPFPQIKHGLEDYILDALQQLLVEAVLPATCLKRLV